MTGYTAGELDGNTSSGVSDIFLVKYDSSEQRNGLNNWGPHLSMREPVLPLILQVISCDWTYL